jgi:PAS domain S-box-containing protein
MDTKILLVDDEERILQTFARTLKLGGYTVITAASGSEGLALYHQEQPDIVLLDLRMPGMSGLEVLQVIREHDPEANVILCTAHGDKEAVIEALRAGASDFLPKPIDQVTLESALRRAEERMRLKRQLRASQEALRRHNERLEEEVKVRTAELEREIKDRKKVEAALRESEEKYRRLVELSPNLIAIHRDGKLLYINQAGAILLGFSSPDQVIGKPLTDYVPPDRREISRERVRQLLKRDQKSSVYKQKIIRPDGTERNVEVVGVPFCYQGETVVQIIAHDITERQKAEDALRESEEKLRSIIEGSPSGIVLCDEEGIVIEWNPAQERISGIPAEEALGQPMWEIAFQMAPEEHRSPQAYERTKAAMREMLSTGRVIWPQQSQEQVIERPDGTRYVVETEVFSIETDQGFKLCSIT